MAHRTRVPSFFYYSTRHLRTSLSISPHENYLHKIYYICHKILKIEKFLKYLISKRKLDLKNYKLYSSYTRKTYFITQCFIFFFIFFCFSEAWTWCYKHHGMWQEIPALDFPLIGYKQICCNLTTAQSRWHKDHYFPFKIMDTFTF